MKNKSSDSAKSSFLARMSHEMRTPLNAIIGMCTIAQAANGSEKVADCLEKIQEASANLLGIINDVLDMANIEAGILRLINDKSNLNQIIQNVVKMKSFNLNAKRQNLVLDIDPDLPEFIITDEHRLTQVLDHFISNAIKFTGPEGTITLSLKKLEETAGSCKLKISIKDSGIGISKEGLKKIFTLFEQVDGGLARNYEGIGTGLVICESIIHLMGGIIYVDSEPGKGSCFTFEITVDKVNLETEKTQGDDEMHKYKKLSILLAEDVEINREIVLALLEDTGANMDCAENGLEALEKYKSDSKKYNLIFMDIHMPEMDGYEATREIRAFERETNIENPVQIIAMTANVFKEDIEKCLEAGMMGHLGKPVDFEELMKKLDEVLLTLP